jgi:hypothetical protein
MSDNCPFCLDVRCMPERRPRARCQSCDLWFYEDTLLCRACLNEGLQSIKGIRCQPIS